MNNKKLAKKNKKILIIGFIATLLSIFVYPVSLELITLSCTSGVYGECGFDEGLRVVGYAAIITTAWSLGSIALFTTGIIKYYSKK